MYEGGSQRKVKGKVASRAHFTTNSKARTDGPVRALVQAKPDYFFFFDTAFTAASALTKPKPSSWL
jgi:hypothetical protein